MTVVSRTFFGNVLTLFLTLLASCTLAKNQNNCSSSSARSLDCSERPLTGSTASEKISDCDSSCNTGIGTLFLPRPQGQNTAALFNPYYYMPYYEHNLAFSVGYRYEQTFRPENIARCLFGSEIIRFAGSVLDASQKTLLADNFGLSPNFKGQVHVKPEIKNHIVDIMTRVDLGLLNDCFIGAYLALNASVVHSIWDLRACQTSQTSTGGVAASKFRECYVSNIPTAIEATNDLQTALSGRYLFGDMQADWHFGKFDLNHAQRATKLANIDLFLGYDFLVCEDYHVGVFMKGVAPTGTKPNGEFVFSPIIGNGHHWEFGGGLTAHYNLLNSGSHSLGCYLDGCVTHLFKDSQWRSFDFKSCKSPHQKAFSRYALLKEFDENDRYTGHLINGINFTTRKIKSSFAAQGDASIRLLYQSCGWALGAGYNVFGRSREKISGLCDPCGEFRNKRFEIKGTQGVCHTASFETGSNKHSSQTATNEVNPDLAVDVEAEAHKFLKTNDIRVKSIPALLTHKIFAHVDYEWDSFGGYQPYLGIGGQAEFAQDNKCRVCTPSQWGVWVRTGLNY